MKYTDKNHSKLYMTNFKTHTHARTHAHAHTSCKVGHFKYPNDILTSEISCYNTKVTAPFHSL